MQSLIIICKEVKTLFFGDINHFKARGHCGCRQLWGCLTWALNVVNLVAMAMTKSAELKNSLLQMCLFSLLRFSPQLKWILLVLTKTWIIFNAHLMLSCSFCLFCSFVCTGLSLGLWDLVPWPGIEPRPPVMWVQSPSHWTNALPEIRILSRSYHAGRTLWLSRSSRVS